MQNASMMKIRPPLIDWPFGSAKVETLIRHPDLHPFLEIEFKLFNQIAHFSNLSKKTRRGVKECCNFDSGQFQSYLEVREGENYSGDEYGKHVSKIICHCLFLCICLCHWESFKDENYSGDEYGKNVSKVTSLRDRSLKVLSKCICHCHCLCLCHCLFFGQVMSPHHSDQMSQRSQVSGVALCITKVKVPSVSD